MKNIRELTLTEKVGLQIANDKSCFPGNDDRASFDMASAACQSKFSETGLSQTQYINGLLYFFRNTVDHSDPRLQPCGPIIGVKKLAMKTGRQNALSLVTDFLKSST